MDLFPTILDMSHISPSKAIQGKSLLPILKQKIRDPHPFIAWEHQGNRAIREGDWKLVWDDEVKKWELYNLKKTALKRMIWPKACQENAMIYSLNIPNGPKTSVSNEKILLIFLCFLYLQKRKRPFIPKN